MAGFLHSRILTLTFLIAITHPGHLHVLASEVLNEGFYCPQNCYCDGGALQCTDLWEFPTNVTGDGSTLNIISLNQCHFKSLSQEMLQNYTDVMVLKITQSALQNIEKGTFSQLLSLDTLDLHRNPLSVASIGNIFCSINPQKYKLKVDLTHIYQGGTTQIPAEQFRCLEGSQVWSVNLSSNALDWKTLENLFCAAGLRPGVLSLRDIFIKDYTPIPTGIFYCMQNASLQELDFSNNLFLRTQKASFNYLYNLTSLVVSHAFFTSEFDTSAFQPMKNLVSLDCGGNNLRVFPNFTDNFGQAYLPTLGKLLLNKNQFQQLAPFNTKTMNNLEYLDISDNLVEMGFIPDDFISALPSISSLVIAGCPVQFIEPNAFISSSLQLLDMSHMILSVLHQSKLEFLFQAFQKATNLRELRVDGIRLGAVPHEVAFQDGDTVYEAVFKYGFQNLTLLETLSMSDIGLNVLYTGMFLNTNNLKSLILSDNRISVIQNNLFINFHRIKDIDLSNNMLGTVDQSILPSAIFKTLQNVGLKYNPLTCDCSMYWFRQLVSNPPFLFDRLVGTPPYYYCSSPYVMQGRNFLTFNPTWEECYVIPLHCGYITAITVSTFLVAFPILFFAVYRFRWHFYFWYLKLRAERFNYHSISEEQDSFTYDAFLCYSSEDIHFLKSKVLPALEDTHDLKLCLHDRDWLAGKDIMDNIAQSMNISRKVVFLVTRTFAQSQWCQIELNMACYKMISQNRNDVILLMMETIPTDSMTVNLAYLMKASTRIHPIKGKKGEDIFWRKVAKAIKK